MCVCTAVQLFGCTVPPLYRYMGVRLYRCVSARLCGCTALPIRGCTVGLLCSCTTVRLHRSAAALMYNLQAVRAAAAQQLTATRQQDCAAIYCCMDPRPRRCTAIRSYGCSLEQHHCKIARLRHSADARPCGCMTNGCVTVRQYACLAAQLYGCTGALLHHRTATQFYCTAAVIHRYVSDSTDFNSNRRNRNSNNSS